MPVEPKSADPVSVPSARPGSGLVSTSATFGLPWRGPWRWLLPSLIAAFLCVVLIVATTLLEASLGSTVSHWLVVMGSAALAVTGLAGTIAARSTLVTIRGEGAVPRRVRIASWLFVICGPFFFLSGSFIVWALLGGSGRGRQIRRRGRLLLPEVSHGDGWTHLELSPELASGIVPELRRSLAERWRENGRGEHASVAAFANLTLQLVGLGAPPRLLRDAQRDAADEIRHAELCFSLARNLDGDPQSPAPFTGPREQWVPLRSLRLARLAVDSLIDGALHEGVSARVIAKLVPRCEAPEIRAVLKELAADEGRHCAHAWDVVEWCVASSGWPMALALRGAMWRLTGVLPSPKPTDAGAGEWECFGIPGRALEQQEYARACVELLGRVESLCGSALASA